MTVRERVFERDGRRCRVCTALGQPSVGTIEWTHLKARGMGGSDAADTTANTICCCGTHHRGPKSLHSGHLKYKCLTDQGADGPMVFLIYERLPKAELGLTRDMDLSEEV